MTNRHDDKPALGKEGGNTGAVVGQKKPWSAPSVKRLDGRSAMAGNKFVTDSNGAGTTSM